jgi:hypothetical protein
VRDCLCENWTSPQELDHRYREIFGQEPIPPEEPEEPEEPATGVSEPDPVTPGNTG